MEKKLRISHEKLRRIGKIPQKIKLIKGLYISHNEIDTLDGISQFTELRVLSIAFNQIKNLEELWKI